MKTRLKGLLGIWLAVIMMVGMVIPAAADNTPMIKFDSSSDPYSVNVKISDDGGTTWRAPNGSDNVSYQWYQESTNYVTNWTEIQGSGEIQTTTPGTPEESRRYKCYYYSEAIEQGSSSMKIAFSGYLSAQMLQVWLFPGETMILEPTETAKNAIESITTKTYQNEWGSINPLSAQNDGIYRITNETNSNVAYFVDLHGKDGASVNNGDVLFTVSILKASTALDGRTGPSLLAGSSSNAAALSTDAKYFCRVTYGGITSSSSPVTYTGLSGGIGTTGSYRPERKKVSFVADGRLVGIVLYKPSQDELTFIPKVPKKEGFVGTWEAYTLNGENMVVRAVYIKE